MCINTNLSLPNKIWLVNHKTAKIISMTQYLPAFLAVILSSILTLSLSLFKISTTAVQQITIFLILVLLIALNRRNFLITRRRELRWGLLLLGSFLTQIIVTGSGALFSPFLFLLLIFTLGTSFLISFAVSLFFLVSSVSTLMAVIYFDKNLTTLFLNDPATAVLYLLSFMAIIPLGEFISTHYKLKDKVTSILTRQVRLGQSILADVNELVILTNLRLEIISVNSVVETLTGLSDSDLIDRKILEVIDLRDESGSKVMENTLSIDEAISNKTSHLIKGLLLYPKNRTTPVRVVVKVQPVSDINGNIDQIIFVISDTHSLANLDSHRDLEVARLRYETLLNTFKNTNLPNNLRALIELISKIESDITLDLEITDHPFKIIPKLENIPILVGEATAKKQDLAKAFNVNLQVQAPRNNADFTAVTDRRYLELLFHRLLDIGIFLSLDSKNPIVTLQISDQISEVIEVSLVCPSRKLTQKEQKELFTQYFGSLKNTTKLSYGSGLEGSIVNTLATHLKIPVTSEYDLQTSQLVLKLSISRGASFQ